MTIPSGWATVGLPDACSSATYVNRSGNTVVNPLYNGPSRNGGATTRRADIDTVDFGPQAAQAQTALAATSFSSFQSQINGVHGSVHVTIGGDMASVPTAAFDPIFYLHHANIDRLWARWQAANPGALPSSEATFELEPFNRPYSTSWYAGSDMESTSALGYSYRNFCFILPPFRLWEVVKFPFEPALARVIESARVVLKAHHEQPEPVEIRAFVNNSDASTGTRMASESGFAGLGGFFAHGDPEPHQPKAEVIAPKPHSAHAPARATVKQRFDLEIDITSALRKASTGKELQLKLVAVDAKGVAVPSERLLLEEITLELD